MKLDIPDTWLKEILGWQDQSIYNEDAQDMIFEQLQQNPKFCEDLADAFMNTTSGVIDGVSIILESYSLFNHNKAIV